MKRVLNVGSLPLFAILSLTALFAASAHADTLNKTIVSRTSEVEGVKLQYLTAGQGAPLILLHWLRGDVADVETDHASAR